jgi:hypothetical protein
MVLVALWCWGDGKWSSGNCRAAVAVGVGNSENGVRVQLGDTGENGGAVMEW